MKLVLSFIKENEIQFCFDLKLIVRFTISFTDFHKSLTSAQIRYYYLVFYLYKSQFSQQSFL